MPQPNLPALPGFGGLATTREDKSLTKHLRSLQASTGAELAHVRATEAVEIAKLEALEAAGHIGLSAVSSLSAHERICFERDPHSLGRAKYIADTTSFAIGNRIETLNRRLG
jgi:hypothetical protein